MQMKLKGLVSGFVMLALLLSVFALPFGSMASWEDNASPFTFNVTDQHGFVEGAEWTVTSVISGKVMDEGVTTSAGKGTTKSLAHDNYILEVSKEGHTFQKALVVYDGTEGKYVFDGKTNRIIQLTEFASVADNIRVEVDNVTAEVDITVTATYTAENGTTGVVVTNSTVSNGSTNVVNMSVMAGEDYNITVEAAGYVKNSTTVPAGGTTTVTMSVGANIIGVTDETADMRAVYIKDDYSADSIVFATIDDNTFSARLADGDYKLFIYAEGYVGLVGNVTVAGGELSVVEGDIVKDGTVIDASLTPMDKRTVDYGFDFGNDMESFDYSVNMTLDFAFSVGELDYNFLPLRAQIDLIYGNGNGSIVTDDVNAFIADLTNRTGAFPAVTDNLLAVEGVTYRSNGNLVINADGLEGDVSSQDGFSLTLNDDYVAQYEIDAADTYEAKSKMTYDTVEYNYTYTFALPDTFEVNQFKKLETNYLSIDRESAGVFVFDPAVRSASPTTVTMEFTTDAEPSAVGSIVASEFAYAVEEDGELQYYIAGKDQNLTFDASQSVDGNDNALDVYDWDFDDGNSSLGKEVTHAYEAAGVYNVTLEVKSFYGKNDSVTFKVKVDDVAPVAEIIKVTATPKAGQSTSFAGHNSTDDIFADDGIGKIVKWSWVFEDNADPVNRTTNGGNVTHVFAEAGTYDVTLTVFDAAGNSGNTTMTVDVYRAESPKFSVKLPDVMPDFEEGQAAVIAVTVNNTGNWDAENVTVTLYYMSGDDWRKLTSSTISDIAVGDEETVNLTWTPGSAGTFRLKANASMDYQESKVEASSFVTVSVDEPGWRDLAIIGAVILVIVLVIVLVYFRNRLPGSGKLNLKGGKDQFAPPKTERPPVEDFGALNEPKKKTTQPSRPSSSSKTKKRR